MMYEVLEDGGRGIIVSKQLRLYNLVRYPMRFSIRVRILTSIGSLIVSTSGRYVCMY